MAKATTRRKPRKSANGEGPSKSEAIRQHFSANPAAKNKEVVEALAGQGIKVTPNYVSMIKSKSGMKKAGRRGPKAGSKRRAPSNGRLEMAVALVRACEWDFDSARQLLSTIETVHKSLA